MTEKEPGMTGEEPFGLHIMTMKLTPRQINAFQKEILDWYKKNRRDLPWRDVPVVTDGDSGASFRDPYKILVSEVMLQQTQVSRVIPKYEAWMKRFPTLESLAKAKPADVLEMWSGLGYNRRALYLQRLARIIATDLRGKFPQTQKELQKLPGIGEYTARAILCFAFHEQIAVVDTNVRKVILTKFPISNFKFQISSNATSTRLAEAIGEAQAKVIDSEVAQAREAGIYKGKMDPGSELASLSRSVSGMTKREFGMTKEEIQEIADKILPKGKAYEWNQALMDYSAAFLRHIEIDFGQTKQSPFKDSDRYFRGRTIRILLEDKKLSFENLFQQVNIDHTIDRNRYVHILRNLERDGLIQLKKDLYCITHE